jgi:hypothetical protein
VAQLSSGQALNYTLSMLAPLMARMPAMLKLQLDLSVLNCVI